MKQLDKYFKLQEEIFKYFGYVEDWAVIPIEDSREYYWTLTGDTREVWFCEDKETQKVLAGNGFNYDDPKCKTDKIYSNEVYTQRHLPKWVYRGDDYTMICVDTRTDGNKFLAIYDNKKRIK